MTKSIYIHIGPHKTGTTTLQFSLFLNKDKLKKNGILYPDSGIISAKLPGHHNLAWEILGDKRF